MDNVDVILCLQLLMNSRISYRELSQIVSLSINSVHKRIQNLIELKIIRNFRTQLNLGIFQAYRVLIFAKYESSRLSELVLKLGGEPEVYWVSNAGNNVIYIGLYLHSIEDLAPISSKIIKIGELTSVEMGIIVEHGVRPSTAFRISKNDYKIIRSLQTDSRKSHIDIAHEVALSPKTVRYHMNRLVENNAIEFTIDWYPEMSNDIICFMHVTLDEFVERNKWGSKIIQNHFPHTLFFWEFANRPFDVFIAIWCDSMRTLQLVVHQISLENCKKITTNIVYHGALFPSWRDELPFY